MIISASRRTDIPAFYGEWMITRLKEGYVIVQNPINKKQFSRVNLQRDVVDCIVFWTKTPQPFMEQIKQIEQMGYPFYFQMTITPYDLSIEHGLPSKASLIESCKRLSDAIGPHRIVWRYDPIIISSELSVAYHLDAFGNLAQELSGYVEQCMFSIYDEYRKTRQRMMSIAPQEPDGGENNDLLAGLAKIASSHSMRLSACCEQVDGSQFGISKAACIDQELIERIVGYPLKVSKDTNQRAMCRCIASIDIGHYDTCPHGCLYCYGTSTQSVVKNNLANHQQQSPLLIGQVDDTMVIKERKVELLQIKQTTLF